MKAECEHGLDTRLPCGDCQNAYEEATPPERTAKITKLASHCPLCEREIAVPLQTLLRNVPEARYYICGACDCALEICDKWGKPATPPEQAASEAVCVWTKQRSVGQRGCSVCGDMRSELNNLAQYLENAPHAEFDRENVEALVRSLITLMDETPNAEYDDGPHCAACRKPGWGGKPALSDQEKEYA